MTKRSHRVRDYTLYFGISFSVVAAIFVAAHYDVSTTAFLNWSGYIGFTAFVFGFLIEKNRSVWREKRFWQLAAALFVLHCLILAVVLRQTGVFGKAWWAAFAVEAIVLRRIVNFVVGRAQGSSSQSDAE